VIRITVPSIGAEDLEAVSEVLRSGFLVQGLRVAAFEESIARYVGTEYAVAVANCTAALHLALLALDVGPGDRVAVTAYSWPATANVIALCGAQPVFVDIDPATFNIAPETLEEVLRHQPVKAILPVHAFGGMADMDAIFEIAARRGIPIVEDAACALGASLAGRRAGTWGTMGCFSFHPRKAITTGEGGVITTDDPALTRRLRALRNHGQDPDAPAPDFIVPGYNLRLTEFQAALGSSQLRKVERIIEARRAGAARYDALLADSGIRPPVAQGDSRHVYQSYAALLPPGAGVRRTGIIAAMRQRGIETTIGTYHIPLTSYFRRQGGFQEGAFPVTDDVAARTITLPLYETMTAREQEAVTLALIELSRECGTRPAGGAG